MDFYELNKSLNGLGLSIKFYKDDEILAVGSDKFANPLLFFNPYEETNKYTGSIKVKAINATLFTKEQIASALVIANDFMRTPLSNRGMEDI